MNNDIKNSFKDYEQMLLNAARYSGNREKEKKIFSASMLGNELLQNYLKFKYGIKDKDQFEANTFGSIYQLGVDVAAEKYNKKEAPKTRYLSAYRIKIPLSNGWIISGEMDQIDTKYNIIFDNKVSTATTVKKIKTEGLRHQYALQLGVYKWLLHKQAELNNIEPVDYKGAIALVNKTFSYYKTNNTNQLNLIEVPTFDIDKIEELLIEVTDLLEIAIQSDKQPERCKNLFPFKQKNGKTLPMRCLYYCDLVEHCKSFKDGKTNFTDKYLLNL